MYDFYPEWGPARNRDEDEHPPGARRATGSRSRRSSSWPDWCLDWSGRAGGPEARDGDCDRPDDN